MDTGNPTKRSYNDKEVGELIQRATELHEQKQGASDRNLTLADVEHIAAELGLAPELVKQAALELEVRTPSRKGWSLWGGPFTVDHDQVIDARMTDEQWERVVLEIRKFTGKTGHVSSIGRAREWTHSIEDAGLTLSKTMVTLRPEEDATALRIHKNFSGTAVVSYFLAFLVGFMAAGITLDGAGLPTLLNFAIAGGTGVGALAAVRASMSAWMRRQKERLNGLADALHLTMVTSSSNAPESYGDREDDPTEARIELPEMDISEPTAPRTDQRLRS